MPIYNNVLAGSGQGAAADLGEEITHSLRFNGSGWLGRAQSAPNLSGDRTFTFSTWFKLGNMAETNIFGIHPSNGNDNWLLNWNNYAGQPGTFGGRDGASSHMIYTSNALFRDPNAWYHLFLTCQSGVISLRVNNILQDQTSTQNHSMDRDFVLGAEGNSGSTPMTAYLAETYFFQGSILDPVSNNFIRKNEDGIWVPNTPTKTNGDPLTAADYGTNGWHLTYDPNGKAGQTGDGASIGADHSPNNNHFTAHNFDDYTADVKVFFPVTGTASTAALGTTLRGITPNGNGGNSIQVTTNDHMDVDFGKLDTSHTLTTTNSGGGVTVFVSPDGTANSWIASNITNTSFTSPQEITAQNGSAWRFMRFTCSSYTVNDVTAPVGNNVQDLGISDTPTSNHSVLNRLFEDVVNEPIDANLATSGASGNFSETTGSVGLGSTESWYAEIYFQGAPTNPPNNQYGFTVIPSGGYNGTNIFNSTNSYVAGWSLSSTSFQVSKNNSALVNGTLSATPDTNSVLQFAYDASTRKLYVGIDNTNWLKSDGTIINSFDASQPSQTLDLPADGEEYTLGALAFTATARINYGQFPFVFTPPTGFKAIQTNNLPTPTIKDGSDHFAVIEGPGTAGFLVYPQPNTPTPTATSAADLVTEEPVAVTTTFTAGINRQAVVFDTISDITNTSIDIDSQSGGFWGGRTVNAYVSSTGNANSWTQVVTNQVFNGSAANTVTIPAQATPYRYIKLLADTTSNSSWATSDGTPILTHAQNKFPSGMYMIKPDSAAIFFYIDPINGVNAAHRTPLPTAQAAYVPTNSNAFAWCWNCPDSFTANGITNGRRNVDAGFSVVKYTGDGTAPRSIPHGLGKKVGWVILWNPDANDTTCFITGLPGTGTNTENLIWNTAEAAGNQFSAGTQHTPTDDDNFIVGHSATQNPTVNGVNQTGINYTAFCWAPVEGYSRMGTYEADGDGPFVYCGFKPKMVIIKSQGADHWHIYDTTRDVQNPCDRVFFIDDTGTETDAGGNSDIDILSNGFKLRGANGAINGGNNYNWVAFAENPFGGENAAPATAR